MLTFKVDYCSVKFIFSNKATKIDEIFNVDLTVLRFLTPHPPSLRGQFLYPMRGQKQTFFDPLPPYFVHVVIEWPIRSF